VIDADATPEIVHDRVREALDRVLRDRDEDLRHE
jgi:hypothetical protein